MFCAIWYYLYNLKNVKTPTGECHFLVKLHAYIAHGNIRSQLRSFYRNYILIVTRINRSHERILLTEERDGVAVSL